MKTHSTLSWNWLGLGVSGRSARTIRNFSLELSPDLVLPNVGQVDFHDFRKYWNFNVLEMVLKTFRFVQSLPINTFILFSSIFQNKFSQTYVCWHRKSGNMEISKFGKDVRRKIIEICLVKSASTSVVCWLVTKPIAKQIRGNWNFRLGTLAPGSQAWGTGLLRLGEPVGGSWGNPGGRLPWPGL